MASVGTVIIDIKADTAKLVSGMDRAERTVKKSIKNIQKTILTLASAYAGIQGIRAFKNMISDSLDAADSVGKLAQKLGLTSEQLSEYQYAAHFSAISTADLNAGLGAMIRRLNNFQRDGSGAAAKSLKALGISADYARKHFTSTDIAFKEILKRLEKMPDGFKKTAIAQDIFSKNASRIMRLSSSDLKKLGDEAQKIGMTISQSTYEMAAAYHDQMDRISARFKGMERNISFGLVKPLDAASKTALKFIDNAFGKTPQQKMLNFEKAGSEAIKSIIYGLGFAKDTITGIDLVIEGIKIAFYGLAGIIAASMEPARLMINGIIDAYNYIAKKLGKDTFDFKLQSSLPDISKKIVDIKNDMVGLTYSMHDGRDAADKFSKNYEKNLKIVRQESKKTKNSIADIANTPLTDHLKNTYEDTITHPDYSKSFQDSGYGIGAYDKANSTYSSLMSSTNIASQKNEIEKAYNIYIKYLNKRTIANYKNTQEQKKEYIRLHGTIKDGIAYQIEQYKKTIPTAYEQGINIMQNLTSTLQDGWMSFFDYTSKGFMDFGNLATNVLNDVYKRIVKMSVVNPLVNSIMGGVSSFLTPSAAPANYATHMGGYANGGVFNKFANGGAFTNTIVDTPTPFAYGDSFGRKLGVMGEAGAEAIMPLQRHNGVLGVKSTPSNVVINVKNESGIPMNFEKIAQAQTDDGQVIDIVMKHLNYDQDFRSAIKGA